MTQTIKISDDLYSRLAKHAQGFDTPAQVIERIMNQFEGIDSVVDEPIKSFQGLTFGKDTTKYLFAERLFGKGRLVLEVVKQYVQDNPGVTYEELIDAFPRRLQGSLGVVDRLENVEADYEGKTHKRHFLKSGEIIDAGEYQVVVCTEWGIGNINDFVKQAKSLGFEIDVINQQKGGADIEVDVQKAFRPGQVELIEMGLYVGLVGDDLHRYFR